MSESLEKSDRVKVSGADIDGIARGKIMKKSKFMSCLDSGFFGFCSVIFGWDMHDKGYTTKVAVSSADNGFADVLAKIDADSVRVIPWENDLPWFLLDFYDPLTKEPLAMCPRGLLKRLVAKFKKMGMVPKCGIEFEFYNFKETPESLYKKNGVGLTPLTNGMFCYSLARPVVNQGFFDDIYSSCSDLGVAIEAIHTESGPGVYEVALAYTDAVRLADNAHIFKTTVKQLGIKHGVMPSFMAKPYADLPGCSGHIHVSLASLEGLNLFAGEGSGQDAMSKTMKHFLAGILVGLSSVMPMLAPTVNSYKRLCGQFWAPSNVTYGFENRTAAIRVIAPPSCPPSATRLEIRPAGSDVNPYLAIAAVVGLGLYGVENKLELPFGPLNGDAQSSKGVALPRNLFEATKNMMVKDSIARKILGDEFVDHFGATRLHECQQFDTAVTSWEIQRYMETV